jgi:hypothetical protein
MHDRARPDASGPAPPNSYASIARKIVLHSGCLVIAIASFVAYEHFDALGQSTPAWACLAAAAIFGFAPVRDLLRVGFAIEGKALHAVHALGGIALVGLPLAGVVSGTPILTTAAKAPFAIMGAAQALEHSNHPRNAKQAAAMQRFAESLPEIAQFTNTKDLTSPANAQRAVVALSDIIAKAQALGETELEADPAFQSAWSQVSTRFGANLGLDAVDLALGKLAANPASGPAVAELRRQADAAREMINDAGAHGRHSTHT